MYGMYWPPDEQTARVRVISLLFRKIGWYSPRNADLHLDCQ